jgi:hypothetical protein
MSATIEPLPEHDGVIGAGLPKPGDIIESEHAFWSAMDYDLESPLENQDQVVARMVGFCTVMKPLVHWFPTMISAAKCCLNQIVRIKRLEATLQVIQGLVVNRTEVTAVTDEARFRFIQNEAGAALLGIEKPTHLVIVIGKKAYLDITLAEAQARYLKATGIEPLPSMVRSFLFVDEFTEEVPNGV